MNLRPFNFIASFEPAHFVKFDAIFPGVESLRTSSSLKKDNETSSSYIHGFVPLNVA